jgi:hypothetical protein
MSFESGWRTLCPCTIQNIERAAQRVPSIKHISCSPGEEGGFNVYPTLEGTDALVEIWANPYGPFVTDLQVYSNTAENREAFVEGCSAAQGLAEAMGLILESDDAENEADIELGEMREGEFPDEETAADPDEFETLHLLKSDHEWDTATIVALDARDEQVRRVSVNPDMMLHRAHALLKPHGRAVSGVRACLIQRMHDGQIVEEQRASFDGQGNVMTVTWQPIGGPL